MHVCITHIQTYAGYMHVCIYTHTYEYKIFTNADACMLSDEESSMNLGIRKSGPHRDRDRDRDGDIFKEFGFSVETGHTHTHTQAYTNTHTHTHTHTPHIVQRRGVSHAYQPRTHDTPR